MELKIETHRKRLGCMYSLMWFSWVSRDMRAIPIRRLALSLGGRVTTVKLQETAVFSSKQQLLDVANATGPLKWGQRRGPIYLSWKPTPPGTLQGVQLNPNYVCWPCPLLSLVTTSLAGGGCVGWRLLSGS